jgi:iron complex outermembrane receptor protein
MHPAPALLRLAHLCALAALFAAPLAAQPAGTLTGRVQNRDAGLYLNNARVSVEGTDLQAFTDESGEYRLAGVPAGTVRLRAFHTGLQPQTLTVPLAPGGTERRDFFLSATATAATDPAAGAPIKLDEFLVAAARETNAEAIAINEQRFSGNLKTVVATESFGPIVQNNIGEFLKYLPGVDIATDQMNVVAIGLRGLPSGYTNIAIDGGDIAAAGTATPDRGSQFHAISLNNASRIEVTKVPSPDMPAASLGGAINLISRNAFERSRAEFRFKAYVNLNSHEAALGAKPGGGRGDDQKSVRKWQPSFDFSYVAPLGKNFGLSVNGIKNDQFNIARRITRTYNSANGGAAPDRPYLQQFATNVFPVYEHRYSAGVRLDWRLGPADSLALSYTGSYLHQDYEQHTTTFNTGNNPAAFGPDFTRGGATAGSVTTGLATQYADTRNNTLRLNYRHLGRDWDITAGAGANRSKFWYRQLSYSQLQAMGTQLTGVRVDFDGFERYLPGRITVRNAAGQVLDPTDLNLFRATNGQILTRDNEGNSWNARLDVARKFSFASVSGALKAGASSAEVFKSRDYDSLNAPYVGPDGRANSGDETYEILRRAGYDLRNYAFTRYGVPRNAFPAVPFASGSKAYALFRARPEFFSPDRALDARNEAINADEITERIDAAYLLGDFNLLRNRLRVVTGVRFERTTDVGRTVLIDNNAQYRTDAAGNVLLQGGRPVLVYPTPRSVEQQIAHDALIYTRLGLRQRQEYDDFYPSLNASYNLRENLVARLGFARTLGRPNFANILGPTTVTQVNFDDPTATGSRLGTITTKNPALKPWTGINGDVRLEYYTAAGGEISVGFFRKQIENFFADSVFLATPEFLNSLGLSEEFVDFEVRAPYNTTGLVHINGTEINVSQSLAALPGFARYFRVFANATIIRNRGPQEADFRGFTPLNVNGGFNFTRRPFSAYVKTTLVGKKRINTGNATQYGPNAWVYQAERLRLDVSFDYQLTRRFGLFASGRNIFNNRDQNFTYGPSTPRYAMFQSEGEYGVLFQVGVRGSF